jgi:hypothetical protein
MVRTYRRDRFNRLPHQWGEAGGAGDMIQEGLRL